MQVREELRGTLLLVWIMQAWSTLSVWCRNGTPTINPCTTKIRLRLLYFICLLNLNLNLFVLTGIRQTHS